MIPTLILMSKVIPPGIEGTMFSLTATLANLSHFILRNFVGTVINDLFVGVTKEKIDKFWILMVIQLLSKFYPLFLINRLVPTNAEVNELQDKYLIEAKIITGSPDSLKSDTHDTDRTAEDISSESINKESAAIN